MSINREASGGETGLAARPPLSRSARPSADGDQRSVKRSNSGRKWAEIALFVGPALIVFFTFVILPVGLAAYYGFFQWNGVSELENFVGFKNYLDAFGDSVFRGAVFNSFLIVFGSIAIQLPLGLGIALLLNRKLFFRTGFRLMIFVPYILSEVVTAVVFRLILQPTGTGPFDAILDAIGLGSLKQGWLWDSEFVMWTVIAVLTWKYIGLAIILFLAGLQGVPEELYEAAQIDGASWWQIQRRITIPMLGPTIRIWAFLSIIGSLQQFDMVQLLTRGGQPDNAATTIAMYMIKSGFEQARYGYASAVAVLLFLITVVVAIFYMVFVLRRDNSQEA